MQLILIIEDDPGSRYLMMTILRLHKYEPISVDSVDALAKLLELNPDLIISDVAMPVVGGYELLYRIKTTDELKHIPVILTTAHGSLKECEILPDGFIPKPFEPKKFIETVESVLNNNECNSSSNPAQ